MSFFLLIRSLKVKKESVKCGNNETRQCSLLVFTFDFFHWSRRSESLTSSLSEPRLKNKVKKNFFRSFWNQKKIKNINFFFNFLKFIIISKTFAMPQNGPNNLAEPWVMWGRVAERRGIWAGRARIPRASRFSVCSSTFNTDSRLPLPSLKFWNFFDEKLAKKFLRKDKKESFGKSWKKNYSWLPK